MVDDCHATGFMGPKGGKAPAIISAWPTRSTSSPARSAKPRRRLGGFIAGPQPVIDLLRQRARPYLFSNALPPMICAAGIAALDLVEQGDSLRSQPFENAAHWRAGLSERGFNLLPGEHPIVPVMIGDARLSQDMAARLGELGVYVAGFFFPVVPKGTARIRTQMNAALTRADLDKALMLSRRRAATPEFYHEQ